MADGTFSTKFLAGQMDEKLAATTTQSYNNQQTVQDRLAENYSQSIRGVKTYQNPATGERVELVGGYDNASDAISGELDAAESAGKVGI